MAALDPGSGSAGLVSHHLESLPFVPAGLDDLLWSGPKCRSNCWMELAARVLCARLFPGHFAATLAVPGHRAAGDQSILGGLRRSGPGSTRSIRRSAAP